MKGYVIFQISPRCSVVHICNVISETLQIDISNEDFFQELAIYSSLDAITQDCPLLPPCTQMHGDMNFVRIFFCRVDNSKIC